MSDTPHTPSVPELVEPMHTNPDAIVENTYALPNDHPDVLPDIPDAISTERFTEYAIHRFEPDADPVAGGRVLVATERTQHLSRLPRFERWNWWLGENRDRDSHIRRGAAIFVAGNALLNLLNGNLSSAVKDVIETGQHIKDSVEDYFHIGWATIPGHDETVTEKHPGTSEYNMFISPAEVGSPEPDVSDIRHLVAKVKDLQAEGKVIDSIEVEGSASDEWLSKPDADLGIASYENGELAALRSEAFMPVLEAEAGAVELSLGDVKVKFSEKVLSQAELETMDSLAKSHGFAGTREAIAAYNSDRSSIPGDLRVALDSNIGNFRGDLVKVNYHSPDTVTVKHIPGTDHEVDDGSPSNEKHDYDLALFPFILPPIPELRRRILERVREIYVDVPTDIPDPELLLLYPEARTQANELVRDAWRLSRKYQNLLREDDRIQEIYRLNYQDGEGNEQCLRALFVDHQPTAETREMVSSLLKRFSLIQDGRLGHELNMIAIYPSDNAGLEHGDPKRFGLGIDIQYGSETRGVAIPALGLMEMYMPTEPTPEELRGLQWTLSRGLAHSAEWVIAHEGAGHFTDITDEANTLSEVANIDGIPYFVTNNRFMDRAQEDYDRSLNEERDLDRRTRWQRLFGRPFNTNLRWDIRRGTEMISGDVEDRHETVGTTDPRLTEATFVRKDRFPTQYSRESVSEHYAESAAQLITGSGIPFGEETETILHGVQPRQGYADTYAVSTAMHDLITDVWDVESDLYDNRLVFPNEAAVSQTWREAYTRLEDDEELVEMSNAARRQPLPPEEELLHIITGHRI